MMINAVLEYLGLKKRPRSASDASERAATRPKTGQTLDEVVMGLVSPSVTVEEAIAAVEEDAITPPAEEVAEEDDDDDEEDGIDPSTLPTLTQSYVLGTLAASASELYPHDSTLNARVVLWRGDITTLRVDAIVNAANKALLGGGGVDGAIHSAAGPGLLAECRFLNGAQTGESKITAGHALPAKHIIHTVGPIYSRNKKLECERLLRACYETTLQLAVNNGCKSLAFSGISTGIYGYPLEDASRVALDTIRTFLSTPAGASLDQVILTVFRSIDVDTYVKITPEYFPPGTAAEEGLEVEKKESEPEFAGEKKDEVTA